jgi:prepilin-type N-terminal cleavage/methylation domain-containing protein
MVKKYFSGFTLVELMIVIVIIAILAALAIAAFTSQIFKGNDAKRKGDLDRIKIAAEEYEKDHNCYPEYITCGVHPDQPVYPYLNNVPCDPITKASYIYTHDGLSCANWFKIFTILENTRDSSATPGIGTNGAFNYYVSSANAPANVVSNITPTPSGGPAGTPGPTPSPAPQDNFWGCRSGVCIPISWDASRPGPECDPNYQNASCYGRCSTPTNECVSWH